MEKKNTPCGDQVNVWIPRPAFTFCVSSSSSSSSFFCFFFVFFLPAPLALFVGQKQCIKTNKQCFVSSVLDYVDFIFYFVFLVDCYCLLACISG